MTFSQYFFTSGTPELAYLQNNGSSTEPDFTWTYIDSDVLSLDAGIVFTDRSEAEAMLQGT